MPTIELKKTPEVKYQKLGGGPREQIRCGESKPGDRLPTLLEMNEQHNHSRTKIKRMHRMLESDGLVLRKLGSGNFVTRPMQCSNGLIEFGGYAFDETPRMLIWAHILDGYVRSRPRQGRPAPSVIQIKG